MMKLRKQATQPQPATAALAALRARLSEIQSQCNADQAELTRLNKLGWFSSPSQSDAAKVSRAARELLNGAAEGLLPPLAATDTADRIQVLRCNVQVATAALDEGQRLVQKLELDAAAERFQARADEVKAVFAGIVDAVISLEHAQQRRDALLKELKLPAHMVPSGWPLLGRLGRTESAAYSFLRALTTAGWISDEKFRAEVARSKKTLI